MIGEYRMLAMPNNPAEDLEGKQIGNWTVSRKLQRDDGQTGGTFSVGYIVTNASGEEAFLKAMDYKKAIGKPNQADLLYEYTSSYRFERDLLVACTNNHMRYVVRILDAGTYLPDTPSYYAVDYIIFEKAERSARNLIDISKNFDYAWALRSLHNIAVATQELHNAQIAHQDLKPSNVMLFKDNKVSKLGDVGRSSQLNHDMPHDDCVPAGDRTYSPFEQLYGYTDPDWFVRRFGCDMFMLGNLIVVYFNNVSITASTLQSLPNEFRPRSGAQYLEALPYLQIAFSEIIEAFNPNMKDSKLRGELQQLVREMCNPDLYSRGDSKERGVGRYSLYRYITRLDVLAKKYEYSLKKGMYL